MHALSTIMLKVTLGSLPQVDSVLIYYQILTEYVPGVGDIAMNETDRQLCCHGLDFIWWETTFTYI